MTYTLMLVVFVLGYAAIAFEHQLKIDKAAAALVTGVLTWTLYIVASHHYHEVEEHLLHHLSEISSILFFLIGAMTIVELVDAHEGFAVITDRIKTTNKVKLMWIIGILSFFFSALISAIRSETNSASFLRLFNLSWRSSDTSYSFLVSLRTPLISDSTWRISSFLSLIKSLIETRVLRVGPRVARA